MISGVWAVLTKLLDFLPAKRKIKGEVQAQGEGQLALGERSLEYWEQRFGWPPEAARYLATAFTFGVRENVAAVLEKAQEFSGSSDFGRRFADRVLEDPSVTGPTLEASKFTTAEELRDLLGRILAEDVHNPRAVSRRAVSVAQDLTPDDLVEFLKLRSATWSMYHPYENYLVLVIGPLDQSSGERMSFDTEKLKINFYLFGELHQLGLVQERLDGVHLRFPRDEDEMKLSYHGRTVRLRKTTRDSTPSVGIHILTKAGTEILRLYMQEFDGSVEGYFEEVTKYWRAQGLDVLEVNG